MKYLARYHSDAQVFKAEDVWPVIARHQPDENTLAMEERLADLADVVVLIVESEGTFTELGAFAISEDLRRKLLPLLDIQFRGDDSFINTGPVRWIDTDSHFAPCIWTRLARILEAAGELDDRLSRIPTDRGITVEDLPGSAKHLVFFVCDVVAVFGPCTAGNIATVVELVVPGTDVTAVPLYLGLGVAMGILESFEINHTTVYYQPVRQGQLQTFHLTKRHIDIPSLRAQVLGTLQGLEQGREALQLLGEHCGTG